MDRESCQGGGEAEFFSKRASAAFPAADVVVPAAPAVVAAPVAAPFPSSCLSFAVLVGLSTSNFEAGDD